MKHRKSIYIVLVLVGLSVVGMNYLTHTDKNSARESSLAPSLSDKQVMQVSDSSSNTTPVVSSQQYSNQYNAKAHSSEDAVEQSRSLDQQNFGEKAQSLTDASTSGSAEVMEMEELKFDDMDIEQQLDMVEQKTATELYQDEEVNYFSASEMEQTHIDLFSTSPLLEDYALTEAKCRSSACKLSVQVVDSFQAMELFNHLSNSLLAKNSTLNIQMDPYDGEGVASFFVEGRLESD